MALTHEARIVAFRRVAAVATMAPRDCRPPCGNMFNLGLNCKHGDESHSVFLLSAGIGIASHKVFLFFFVAVTTSGVVREAFTVVATLDFIVEMGAQPKQQHACVS